MTMLDDIKATITPLKDALQEASIELFPMPGPLLIYTEDAMAINKNICDAIDSLEEALGRVEELMR